MQAKLLPLFPLQVVVFPRTQLPLHIFEDRYKEMVGEAIRDKSEFGIVLTKDDPRLQKAYAWLMEEFDNGRQTSVEWEELALILPSTLHTL